MHLCPKWGDVITVGAELVMALQTILARKMALAEGVVVSVTEFLTNGQRNVLSGVAHLKGDVRARLPDDRLTVERFMSQITNGVAAAHGISVEMKFNAGFIETINALDPTEAIIRVATSSGQEVIGPQ
jgi:metal-dependent amidase/aminoacylase/carboxypeptidase family protein